MEIASPLIYQTPDACLKYLFFVIIEIVAAALEKEISQL